MNNVKELLPIGSVVVLEGGSKRLMITGVKQTDKGSGEEYDYIGVLYPEGSMGEGTQFFFEHANIQIVFFRGFEDEERTAFIERLHNFYENSQ